MSRFRVLALLLMSACGDDRELVSDAAPSDAGDRGEIVRVRYIAPPESVDQATVLFQYEDSTLVALMRTDGAGLANVRMARAGSVTLYVQRATSIFIYTYMGVHPGEEVVFDNREATGALAFRHFFLGVPTVPNGGFYQLETSCGAENASVAATELLPIGNENTFADCPPNIDMLVTAYGDGISYMFHPDVPVSESSVVRLPGPYRPLDRVNIEITGASEANGSSLNVTVGTLADQSRLAAISLSGELALNVTNGRASASVEVAAPPNASQMIEVVSLAPGPGVPHLVSWGPSSTDLTLDLARDMPRDYLTVPQYDQAMNAIVWTEPESGRLADAMFGFIAWTSNGTNYQWHVQAPRGPEPRLGFPRLPGELLPSDNVFSVTLLNIATDRGLDGIGKRLLASWFPGELWPVDAPSGEVRYREIGTIAPPPQ